MQTLERSYLLRINGEVVERPQHMLMRVSLGIHKEVPHTPPILVILEVAVVQDTLVITRTFHDAVPGHLSISQRTGGVRPAMNQGHPCN